MACTVSIAMDASSLVLASDILSTVLTVGIIRENLLLVHRLLVGLRVTVTIVLVVVAPVLAHVPISTHFLPRDVALGVLVLPLARLQVRTQFRITD